MPVETMLLSVTEPQWDDLEKWLPRGNRAADPRGTVEALFYVVPTEFPWVYPPVEFRNPDAATRTWERWYHDGIGGRVGALPGEESGSTVFVIHFQDGCAYVGYTNRGVFARLDQLVGGVDDWGSDDFVTRHCQAMVYVVRCVATNLEGYDARHLCDLLVSKAPDHVYTVVKTAMVSGGCWLRDGDAGDDDCVEEMSFAEWVELGGAYTI